MSGTYPLSPKALAFWPAAVVIVVTDFVTKRIAESQLLLHTPREVFGEWMRLTLTYNTGAAMNFSLGEFSRVGLSAIAVAMIVVLYRMHRSAAANDVWQSLALGLVVGGALGNLLDRLRSAKGVVDFIDIGAPAWRFWTFNVADSGVSVGAVLLALILLIRPDPQPAGASSAPPATPE
ncbi:MAG: signal peptidase II [Gemmatimonadetes bacterium]|nr:signal peptidase II [Gemmatimonadota bacterium]